MKKRKFCQSCEYPMERDQKGFGTNTDCTVSEK